MSNVLTEDLNPEEKPPTQFGNADENNAEMSNEIRLINEGAYGCIYYPGLKCNGKIESMRYITKIQRNTVATQNEWNISSRIQKIPSFRNYFAPIIKQCPVKVAKKYVRDIKKCQVFKDESDDKIATTDFVSNKILFLGNETLNIYFDKIVSETTSYASTTLFFWKRIIETHLRLLHAVELLLTNGIIHMDIKSKNIMIDPTQQHPIIIDFGISIDLKKITPENSFYIYDTYTPWCIDIVLCNYVIQKVGVLNATNTKVTEKEIDEIIQVFQYGSSNNKTRNEVFTTSIVSQNTLEQYRVNLKQYLMNTFSLSNKKWEDVYTHMIQNTYPTWDSYGLSAMFLTLLDDFKQSKPDVFYHIETAVNGTIMKKYLKILEHTLFALPENRMDIKTTIEQLTELQNI